MPEDALHKSAAASNENRVSKAPSQDSGRSTDGWVAGDGDASASAQSSLKSESLTKTAFDGELLAGTTEVHSPPASAASNGTLAGSSRLPDDPWSSGFTPAPLPEELEPSRKIETPDMLRWRAEMLLDEMMVGAVDVSAGNGSVGGASAAGASAGDVSARDGSGRDGSGWRASAHHDASLPLDEHPRIDSRSAAPQMATAAESTLQVEPSVLTAAPERSALANTGESVALAGVATVDKAAVRAALPPRSATRMPTPIGRNGEQTANGSAENGHSANGHSVNGTVTNGAATNGAATNGSGNGNGNGKHDTPSVTYSFADVEFDPLAGDIADDGRPASHPNGTVHESGANGMAPRLPTRLDGPNGTAAPDTTVATNGHDVAHTPVDSAVDIEQKSTPDTTATGYALDSSTPRASRRTTTATMVDPLEEMDANPPLPSSLPSSLPSQAAQTTTPSAFSPASPTAPEMPRTPARSTTPAESPYTTPDPAYSAPVGVSAPSSMSSSPNAGAMAGVTAESGARSLAAQYSAYAPPPNATPEMPPQVEAMPKQSAAGRGESKGKLTAVEQRYPRQIQSEPRDRTAASSGAHNDALPNESTMQTSGLGPVRINPAVLNSASITGAMAVGSRASSRYASLLPRATPWDLHEMEREIVALQEEMARVMPQGHESTRRARHLLEKAQTIFVNDPLRSAEVDYYLTQVKAIVQRSHQTHEWSERYRTQLKRYHWAWIGFSTFMLALCLLFGAQLQGWAVALFGLNETGILARNLVPAAIAVFAGSLGASVGALFTMRRYHKLALGYFDRKYSLRGLTLPVIGMLGGLVFYGLFSTLYWAMGAGTPLPLALEILPTALAFLAGFLQENLYGTRD